MATLPDGPWEGFWTDFDVFYGAVSRYPAVNINASGLRDDGRRLVQRYFREALPQLVQCELPAETLKSLNASMQSLMRLTSGQNNKKSYFSVLRPIRKQRPDLEGAREYALSKAAAAGQPVFNSKLESDLYLTLEKLVPTGANSYLQAVRDLSDTGRLSLRGTADELRETLREVLDHLAPDDVVAKSAGFTLEAGRPKPTMKQKARFILKSRKTPSGARTSAEDAIERVEESSAALARSVYERGSVSSHITMTRAEVIQLKRYVDAVLSELLQVQ